MRRALAVLLPLAFVVPLGAQGFEGTVVMRMTPGSDPNPVMTTMQIKGSMVAMTVTLPASAGPAAGVEAHMIFDQTSQKMTMLMPMPPGVPGMDGAKGMKIVSDRSKARANANESGTTIKKLGTSQTVAGYQCDDYQTTSANGETVNLCVTDKIGRFTMPSNPRTRAPAWTHAFGDKPVFPLKVWKSGDTKSFLLEVTSIQRGAVPADAFNTSPEGYRDMSAMMGGMGGGDN